MLELLDTLTIEMKELYLNKKNLLKINYMTLLWCRFGYYSQKVPLTYYQTRCEYRLCCLWPARWCLWVAKSCHGPSVLAGTLAGCGRLMGLPRSISDWYILLVAGSTLIGSQERSRGRNQSASTCGMVSALSKSDLYFFRGGMDD